MSQTEPLYYYFPIALVLSGAWSLLINVAHELSLLEFSWHEVLKGAMSPWYFTVTLGASILPWTIKWLNQRRRARELAAQADTAPTS